MNVLAILFVCCFSLASSLPAGRLRAFANKMYNPNLFMDPSFSVGGQDKSQTQDSSVMQTLALNIVQNQGQGNEANRRQVNNMAQPPMGSQTIGQESQNQGQNGAIQSQDKIQPGIPSQTSTLTNGQPSVEGSKFQVDIDTNSAAKLPQGPNMANMNRPGSQMSRPVNAGTSDNTKVNTGLQQTASVSNMFNPGNSNSLLQGPPGTGLSQFNNNLGSRNSMLNVFGANGLSVDPSNFFKPKQNPDGSISGAAGNASGPPTMGPGLMQVPNSPNNSGKNNNYNNMFGPPSFFMNPGSSFGQK